MLHARAQELQSQFLHLFDRGYIVVLTYVTLSSLVVGAICKKFQYMKLILVEMK